MQTMLNDGISTRRGIMCSHREPAYADGSYRHELVESESAQDESVLLPLYPGMTPAEQVHVVSALRKACRLAEQTALEAHL
jgi:dTDP-4-amino-4,6-dideoxygalactose transaminase